MKQLVKGRVGEGLRRYLNKAPGLCVGPDLVNQLGLQPLRTLYYNFWRLKPKALAPEMRPFQETLDRDGILLLNDYMSPEDFATIRREFDERYENYRRNPSVSIGQKEYDVPELQSYYDLIEIYHELHETPLTLKYFGRNSLPAKLISAACHRPIGVQSSPMFYSTRLIKEVGPELLKASHTVNYWHNDVIFPSFKIFFFLNDVNEENGAFHYVPGSHKVTWQRLKLDHALARDFRKKAPFGATMDDGELRDWGLKGQPVIAKANSMLIFNVMGLHKRGLSSIPKPRETIHVDFRVLETTRNSLKAVAQQLGWRNG